VLNFGGFGPIFALPAGFKLRLGSRTIDEFVSGTFPVGNFTIGYLRIPSFAPGSVANALSQLEGEVAFFKQNTDGLVIDEMRNPGGIVYYTTEIARRLIPGGFRTIGFQLRATREWVNTFSSYYENAKAVGAPAVVIAFYKSYLDDVNAAYSGGRGDTGPLPLDQIFLSPQPFSPSIDVPALKDNGGNVIGYDKPMLLLVDEFSVSGGDAFAAVMQDNKAATLFGHRTGGLGGTNVNYTAGSYSEAVVGVTRGLMVRKAPVVTQDFPTTQYVENVGVRPEIESDYMTLDNLLQNGAPFVNAFSQAIANLITASKK
jgi:C-terminal processing protease CtpA/Prc